MIMFMSRASLPAQRLKYRTPTKATLAESWKLWVHSSLSALS